MKSCHPNASALTTIGTTNPAASSSQPAKSRHHRRQHEHLEVGRLHVHGEVGRGRTEEQQPGDHAGPLGPESPPGLACEQQGGRDLGEDREHPHTEEVVGAGDPEGRGVEVGDDGRLAVDGVVVEAPTPVDDLGLRGEIGLVRVEDLVGEPGRVQREGDHDEQQRGRDERAGGPAAAVPNGRFRAVDGGHAARLSARPAG
jgi:hypothetical protein